MFSVLTQELKDKAYSLEKFGANEYAWDYEEVKKVVSFLAEHGYAILGGDVWKREKDEFVITYDSWYLNHDKNISWATYVEQSKKVSLTYIETYFQRNGEMYYYAPFASKKKNT